MKGHVLLVEDHPDDEFLTLHMLRKNSIIDVVVTREGQEAVSYLFEDNDYRVECRSYLPQLILLDLRLPKIDGFELLERIRADRRTRGIPVVVLSSSQYENDMDRCRELGASAFISKPLDAEKMNVILKLVKNRD